MTGARYLSSTYARASRYFSGMHRARARARCQSRYLSDAMRQPRYLSGRPRTVSIPLFLRGASRRTARRVNLPVAVAREVIRRDGGGRGGGWGRRGEEGEGRKRELPASARPVQSRSPGASQKRGEAGDGVGGGGGGRDGRTPRAGEGVGEGEDVRAGNEAEIDRPTDRPTERSFLSFLAASGGGKGGPPRESMHGCACSRGGERLTITRLGAVGVGAGACERCDICGVSLSLIASGRALARREHVARPRRAAARPRTARTLERARKRSISHRKGRKAGERTGHSSDQGNALVGRGRGEEEEEEEEGKGRESTAVGRQEAATQRCGIRDPRWPTRKRERTRAKLIIAEISTMTSK